jgi:hypothetical protein
MKIFDGGDYTIVVIHPPPEPEGLLREILAAMK